VVLRHWKLEEIEGLSPEAEEARIRVLRYMARLESVGRRLVERRQAAAAAETIGPGQTPGSGELIRA
jgi:hypothetical protein